MPDPSSRIAYHLPCTPERLLLTRYPLADIPSPLPTTPLPPKP